MYQFYELSSIKPYLLILSLTEGPIITKQLFTFLISVVISTRDIISQLKIWTTNVKLSINKSTLFVTTKIYVHAHQDILELHH